jgi:GH18 family chitinase
MIILQTCGLLLKTICIALGNWYENPPLTISPKQFSSIARNEEITASFVNNVTAIAIKNNLDGVNIRWTYPSSPLVRIII